VESDDADRRTATRQAQRHVAVVVAIAPEELEGLDAAALKRRYDAQIAQQQPGAHAPTAGGGDSDDDDQGGGGERAKKKRRRGGGGAADKNKLGKEFKF
jgi:hypothetical protein